MPMARLRSKAQITLPKQVVRELNLSEGDLLDISVKGGRIVLNPQTVVPKDVAWLYTPEAQASLKRVKLSGSEKRALARARKKMKAINEDLLHSRGLTLQEVNVAIKVGLIPKDEAYSWTEEWQKDLRASERDIQAGRVSPAFDNARQAIAYLHEQMEKPTL